MSQLTKSKEAVIDPALEAAITQTVERAVAAAMATHKAPAPKRMMDTAEAMLLLGCSRTSLYKFIADGSLKPKKLGSKNRFRMEEVEALLAA